MLKDWQLELELVVGQVKGLEKEQRESLEKGLVKLEVEW